LIFLDILPITAMATRHFTSTVRNWYPLIAALAIGSSTLASDTSPSQVTPTLREQSVAVLQKVMDREDRWVKVHAAEYLLQTGYPEGVRDAFLAEARIHGTEPQYRIGIWRVLAWAADSEQERAKWIGTIRDVFLDVTAPDRPHAAETLAKLKYKLLDGEIAAAEQAADPKNVALAPCATWILANSGRLDAETRLDAFLESPNVDVRCDAAYGFRHLRSISEAARERLLTAVVREPPRSRARVFVVAAAAVHALADNPSLKAELLRLVENGTPDEKLQACQTLAQIGDNSDLLRLVRFLDDANADFRATAAGAILRIERRATHFLTVWDWTVIEVYAVAVLAVGWYYSRITKTREDYLLGNRQMRPVMVGVSLFASLISTISYLSWPGEIIKNGPMIMCALLSYPLIGLVVGWFIIPFIMRLKVTSAYEILELRLGGAVRTLGSLLFLSLRLLWMSVIVYATSSKVLIPLLGLDPRFAPVVCAVLATMTIIYTAMGGLRAVVVTDAIQAAILFGAAIATVITITVCLGSVQAWWPTQWPAHWPEPVYGYDPNSRVTLFSAMLATFTWYVCTSASDQIAVQRYLSTRDAKAARTVLFISLAADVLVSFILAAVGLGLLAYFHTYPHLLPDGENVLADSDKLFPQFIMIGLPVGISGLVVAGLLACAMSALAAGINSTCSVITVDILDRLRATNRMTNSGRVGQLKYVSILVGVTVVALSLFVNMVHGNLLEVAYKVVNLLTVPLAGLFFLAMFVPWARGFGAMIGAACGLTVVVAVSYWTDITGQPGISFLWAMPLSLVAEVGVGALVSLIPIRRNAWDTNERMNEQ
jgi:solute:Na+ symporter, SSS family